MSNAKCTIHWTEPTEWKRVKDNAREIARTYHWRTLCIASGALAFAGCLCARLLVPETAAFLTWPRIAGIVVAVLALPLSVFVGSLQTGSVVFRRKVVDVSDSFVHVWIPYEKVVRFGFERFAGKTYFAVRGMPQGKDEEIEVHVALTSKHSEAEVKAYLIQRGMGSVISETCELQASPIRTTIPVVPHEAQLGVMVCYRIAAVVVPLIFIRLLLDPDDWNSVLILLGSLGEFFIWDCFFSQRQRTQFKRSGQGIARAACSCAWLAIYADVLAESGRRAYRAVAGRSADDCRSLRGRRVAGGMDGASIWSRTTLAVRRRRLTPCARKSCGRWPTSAVRMSSCMSLPLKPRATRLDFWRDTGTGVVRRIIHAAVLVRITTAIGNL